MRACVFLYVCACMHMCMHAWCYMCMGVYIAIHIAIINYISHMHKHSQGVLMVAAAGNEAQDACNVSPAASEFA